MTERGVKLRRIVVLCVGSGVSAGAHRGHHLLPDRVCEQAAGGAAGPSGEGLPAPGRGAGYRGRGSTSTTCSRRRGPWGQRYILRRSQAYNYMDMEDGTMLVYEAATLEEPIVLSASVPLEVLVDGMEVRLE